MSSIYLVDDHALLREGLRAVLEAAGHRIAGESADPTEALGALLRDPPELLLLDLSLGARSGFELLSELHRRHHPVPPCTRHPRWPPGFAAAFPLPWKEHLYSSPLSQPACGGPRPVAGTARGETADRRRVR